MIRSVFILGNQDILMERHYTQPIDREIPQAFALATAQYANPNEVPPIMCIQGHPVANITLDELTFLAILGAECNTYMPLQFLQKLSFIFEEYGGCTIGNIYDNYFILYQVLEEVCDGGVPLFTDLNLISQIVPVSKSWKETVESSENRRQTSMQSNIARDLPNEAIMLNYRPKDVTHAIQSCNLQYHEKLFIQQGSSGIIQTMNCQGRLTLHVLVSGSPQILIGHKNPDRIVDVSLGRNANIAAWNRDRVLDVTPIDGVQTVFCYKAHVDANRVPLNVEVRNTVRSDKKLVLVVSQLRPLQRNEHKDVTRQPRLYNITCAVPLNDYDLLSKDSSHGTTQLTLTEGNRRLTWCCQLGKDGRAELTLKLDPRKLGRIVRLPIVSCRYSVSNYVVSDLQPLPCKYVNERGKISSKVTGETVVCVEILD